MSGKRVERRNSVYGSSGFQLGVWRKSIGGLA
jgi:hypothetical protein